MVSLQIEHPIRDLGTWLDAFSRHEAARLKAGVLTAHVRRPVDDETYVVVDLTFVTAERAAAFRTFLEENVWASRDASPALAGAPVTRILTDVDVVV
jgi:hypothetical protein